MSLDDRNAKLEKQLEVNPIDQQIATLARADARRKNQVKLLALSLALDVLLTIGFGFVTIQTNNIATKAENAQIALVERCKSTNEARVKNAKLWDYLVDQSKGQSRTAKQQKFFDDFVKLKDETFAQSDCNKVIIVLRWYNTAHG